MLRSNGGRKEAEETTRKDDRRGWAARLLVYGLTGEFVVAGKTAVELRREWAGILTKSVRSVTLPSWAKLKK
jgi:hypothetical protein